MTFYGGGELYYMTTSLPDAVGKPIAIDLTLQDY
jgi:hypothetical protein